jgi:hypothetical protein
LLRVRIVSVPSFVGGFAIIMVVGKNFHGLLLPLWEKVGMRGINIKYLPLTLALSRRGRGKGVRRFLSFIRNRFAISTPKFLINPYHFMHYVNYIRIFYLLCFQKLSPFYLPEFKYMLNKTCRILDLGLFS